MKTSERDYHKLICEPGGKTFAYVLPHGFNTTLDTFQALAKVLKADFDVEVRCSVVTRSTTYKGKPIVWAKVPDGSRAKGWEVCGLTFDIA